MSRTSPSEPLPRGCKTRVGVDPGPVYGGLVVLTLRLGLLPDVAVPLGSRPRMDEIRRWLAGRRGDQVAVEWVTGGRIASTALLETAVEVGRVIETVLGVGGTVHALSRSRVGSILGVRGDAHTRRWLLDRWSRHPRAIPGADRPALGSKSAPGPLYGVARDAWAALAVAHASLVARDKIFR